ncbi:MAG: T9SS type A sorting domain-containing protein [Saprospiraceae bacterium]|nr:T9SS type A sorting domain-containing protein [Saprospiraceae bacterium]
MKKYLLLSFFALFSLSLSAQTVNFSEHIAPIVYKHCTGCHRPGEVGPMPLTNYQQISVWGPMIKYVTGIRYMPPWKADPEFQHYLRENTLTDEEIQQIADWVDNGKPQGDPALEPPLPIFPEGSQVGTPDLVLSFAETHVHPGNGIDEYRYFVLPTGLTESRDLVALEIRPGNRRVVHHTLVWTDTTGTAAAKDAATPEYGYVAESGIGIGGNLETFQNQLPGYVPGQRPPVMTNGMAMRLPANADLLLQMHYAPTPVDEPDSSSVLLFFADEPAQRYVKNKIMLPLANTLTNGPFIIPANQTREFHGRWTVPEDISVIGIAPHMHLLGTHWRVFAVTPSNDTINLIRINEWDFNWQGSYSFRNPQVLPQGTVVNAYAGYDNTANNPANPNSPPQWITWGEGTSDEMYYLPISYVSYQPGDENLELDDMLVNTEDNPAFHFLHNRLYPVSPNPARENLKAGFTLGRANRTILELYNMQGQPVQRLLDGWFLQGQHTVDIQVEGLAPGVYCLRLIAGKEQHLQKFVVVD